LTAFLGDTNIWFALSVSGHSHDRIARTWFEELGSSDQVYFCRSTQQSFLRLVTTASILAPYNALALSNAQAWNAYDDFLSDSRVSLQDEPAGLDRWWRQYSHRKSASPKLWMDAYLAAFARAGGCRMVTTDAAFKQFAGLDLLLLE
jgi:toxin-antitoxin system PIN domain toxin